jgi:hypothetical protein
MKAKHYNETYFLRAKTFILSQEGSTQLAFLIPENLSYTKIDICALLYPRYPYRSIVEIIPREFFGLQATGRSDFHSHAMRRSLKWGNDFSVSFCVDCC